MIQRYIFVLKFWDHGILVFPFLPSTSLFFVKFMVSFLVTNFSLTHTLLFIYIYILKYDLFSSYKVTSVDIFRTDSLPLGNQLCSSMWVITSVPSFLHFSRVLCIGLRPCRLFLTNFGMSFGIILVQFMFGQSCWCVFMGVTQTWIVINVPEKHWDSLFSTLFLFLLGISANLLSILRPLNPNEWDNTIWWQRV